MRIALGADHAGVHLKDSLKRTLDELGVTYQDFGTGSAESVDYPDFAHAVANGVAGGQFERGILVCGTGIGMAISANKVRGIRAAQCHDTYSAERASRSNDAQIITLGARVVGPELAKAIVDAWLASTFDGGRSQPKVDLIQAYEAEHLV